MSDNRYVRIARLIAAELETQPDNLGHSQDHTVVQVYTESPDHVVLQFADGRKLQRPVNTLKFWGEATGDGQIKFSPKAKGQLEALAGAKVPGAQVVG